MKLSIDGIETEFSLVVKGKRSFLQKRVSPYTIIIYYNIYVGISAAIDSVR